MPAKSVAQQKAAGAALSVRRGATPKSKLRGVAKFMEETMSLDELEELAPMEGRGRPGPARQ
jgi:hypothetical protein